MKIACITHSSSLHGAERCYYEGIKSLAKKGVEMYAIYPNDGPLVELCREYVKGELFLYSPWWGDVGSKSNLRKTIDKFKQNLDASNKLASWFHEIKPDYVITNTGVIPYAAIAAYKAKIPHIWFLHEFGREDHNIYWDFGEYLTCKAMNCLSKRFMVNSEAIKKKYIKYLPESKIDIVNQTVEVKIDEALLASRDVGAEKTLQLIILGWLTPGKRQDDAIKAIGILAKKGLDVHLKVVGNGEKPFKDALKKYVEANNLSKVVEFHDFTTKPMELLALADVLLMCSVSEAFGRVTVEGMKCGRAVIGANAAGTTSLIEHGVTGLLYEAKNPEDLSRKIEMLYQDRELLRKIASTSMKRAREFYSLESYAEQILEVIKKV